MVLYRRLRTPGRCKMRKTTIIMLIVAIVAVAGTQLGWW
ncbi:hypothetical protein DBY68_013950 [Pseudocitrobacter sp. RIT415]|nr:hypothetical protein DBY68_013950 [Pseudocitrobacter sp. RIT 415]